MEVTAQAKLAAKEQSQRNDTRGKLAEFIKTLDALMTAGEEPTPEQNEKPADKADPSLAPMLRKARANLQGPEHLALFGVAVRSSPSGEVIVDGGYYSISDLTVSKAPAPKKGLIIQAKGARFPYHLDVGDKTRVTILGGRYEDKIRVADDVTRPLTIRGLEGNDEIWGGRGGDAIFAGAGNDYVDGGGGNDAIHGEDGYDVLYGQNGADVIHGGDGRDYIDGGDQKDWLWGGAKADIISGGKGSDAIAGEAGNDVIVTGSGRDAVSDRQGINTFYTESGDTIAGNPQSRSVTITPPKQDLGRSVFIFGDERFARRIESDLEMLRHVPVGQKALTSLDASSHSTAIRPRPAWSEDAATALPVLTVKEFMTASSPFRASDSLVSIEPAARSLDETNNAQDWRAMPPSMILFHEMAHARTHVHGMQPTGSTLEKGVPVENRELAVTGVAWDQNGDGKPDPSRWGITENGLRSELGWPRRPSYDVPPFIFGSEPES